MCTHPSATASQHFTYTKGRGEAQGVSVKTGSAMPIRTELSARNTGLESVPMSLSQDPAFSGGPT